MFRRWHRPAVAVFGDNRDLRHRHNHRPPACGEQGVTMVTMFRLSVTRALVTTVALFGALACGNKSKDEAKPPATIKIGLVASFSGPFADIGKQIENGIKAYLKEHGDTVAGKKIEILRRDTTGPEGEVAKRLAQELVS